MRDDLARAIRELPAELSRASIDATKALFGLLQEPRPYRDVRLSRDERYGPHERHRLDVFSSGGSGRPVFVYVHGGGFVGGDKADAAGPFPYYENVGVWAARCGFVGVTITYRRAPEHRWPAGAEDVGAALRWLHANVGALGGDPARIVLMGQSAGATHVASYVALSEHHAAPGGGIRGAIVFSGVYDFVRFGASESVAAYLGDADRAAASPLRGLAATPLALLFASAELDPPEFHAQAKALFDARYDRLGRMPDYLYLAGHNHISPVAHLGTLDAVESTVGERLANFVRTVSG